MITVFYLFIVTYTTFLPYMKKDFLVVMTENGL